MMLGAWIGMGAQSVGTETEITVTDSGYYVQLS